MARHKGFLHALAQAQRTAERQRAAQVRAQTTAAQTAARAHTAYLRSQEQASRVAAHNQRQYELESARLYVDDRLAEVAWQNAQLEQTMTQLTELLAATLPVDDFLDLETLKQVPTIPPFDPGPFGVPAPPPNWAMYSPPEPSGVRRFLPGGKDKQAQALAEARTRYEADLAEYTARETARQTGLADRHRGYEQYVADLRAQAAAHNAEITQFQQDFAAGQPDAVVNYCTLVLEASAYPEDFPQHAKLAYVPESKQLVVEYDLPPFAVVPEVSAYKYVKAKDDVTTTARPATQRKALYASVIAQVTLRTLHELFEADRAGHIDTLVFNGYVEAIDRGTGRPVRTCLVTVRTSRDVFTGLDLSRVEPEACLKVLNAGVSKSPAELAPVRPVLEFNMVDRRFIEETDVLSGLDQRPNLMDLTPSEFEALIANLFRAMGLETRLTQASRDGGVDCVAYDPRPILGGKVVIQAKRYKHTVGVSAVRDLFGTLQNEGASKGILVTTSGYGKAAFEFAAGKPIELLDGANLLYLLKEHAGVDAKIVAPEEWRDPVPDAPPE